MIDKLNELFNTKYTKYADSVRKHHCVPNLIKTLILFFNNKFHKNLDAATVVQRSSIIVMIGF